MPALLLHCCGVTTEEVDEAPTFPPCPSPARWHEAPLLPGVARLVAHLRMHNIPMALATSTSRATLARKLSSKAEMREAFAQACCGDEVANGKAPLRLGGDEGGWLMGDVNVHFTPQRA